MFSTLTFAVFLVGALGAVREWSGFERSINERIQNGRNTDIKKHPFMVAFEVNGAYRCGGSIIGDYWALTAAHCTEVIRGRDKARVRVGSSYFNDGGSLHLVTNLTVHPGYNATCRQDCNGQPLKEALRDYNYDFTLLKVEEPFQFSDTVKAIPLATERPPSGATVVVTGWGHLKYNGTFATQLQEADVNIVDIGECKRVYKEFCTEVSENMFCAGDSVGGKDACHGDSGGPLVYEEKLAGVVSFGIGCGLPEYPAIYADVAAVREWITSITKVN